MLLRGIIPPVVTPMLADESIDLPRQRQWIDHLLGVGVHGIFVLGTTGEFYALSEAEKQEVIASTVAHVNRRVPVIAGTGAETTREAIRITRLAEREGADAVAVIAPYFIKPTQAEIFDHFRRIADATKLPVLLYHNPVPCGGVSLDVDTVARLAEVPNIVGMKDSFGDLQTLIEYVKATPRDRFVVFQGRDTLIVPALQFGAAGSVPGLANIAPEWCVGLYEAYQRGDLAAALNFQAKLSPIRIAAALGTAPGAIKAAMALLGRPMGPSRSPVSQLTGDKQQKLRSILEQTGLLKGEPRP